MFWGKVGLRMAEVHFLQRATVFLTSDTSSTIGIVFCFFTIEGSHGEAMAYIGQGSSVCVSEPRGVKLYCIVS